MQTQHTKPTPISKTSISLTPEQSLAFAAFSGRMEGYAAGVEAATREARQAFVSYLASQVQQPKEGE